MILDSMIYSVTSLTQPRAERLNMKLAIAALTLCLSTSVFANNSEWQFVADTKDGNFNIYAKKHDMSVEDGVAMVITKTVRKKPSGVEFYLVGVKLTGCKAKFGEITHFNLQGDFKFNSDFVFGGGNVAAAIATYLCHQATWYK